jgi:hypothetical protein
LGKPLTFLSGLDSVCRRNVQNVTRLPDRDDTTSGISDERSGAATVAEAYGWLADLPEEEALARLLALNLERAVAQS